MNEQRELRDALARFAEDNPTPQQVHTYWPRNLGERVNWPALQRVLDAAAALGEAPSREPMSAQQEAVAIGDAYEAWAREGHPRSRTTAYAFAAGYRAADRGAAPPSQEPDVPTIEGAAYDLVEVSRVVQNAYERGRSDSEDEREPCWCGARFGEICPCEVFTGRRLVETPSAEHMTASEALFGFMGWLTSLPYPVVFSASHDAAKAVELIAEWSKVNNLSPPADDFHKRIVHPAAPVAAEGVAPEPDFDTTLKQVQQELKPMMEALERTGHLTGDDFNLRVS